MEITKEFLKDFRACDQVVVRTFGQEVRIELTINLKRKSVKCTSYDFHDKSLDATEKSFWYLPYKRECTVGVLSYLLKAGDIVRFYPYKNGSDLLRENGLNNDQLCISIERKFKQIIPRMVITSSLCPSNSARAIQPFV